MKTAIIGGGAAGFFCAIRLKSLCGDMEVDILERQNRVLTKVEISGGGRCNCTNTFAEVKDLAKVYPRGHKLMKRLFHHFGPDDAFDWFEAHGVDLVAQDDGCVFPMSQDSHSIIDCFLKEASRLGVRIVRGHRVDDVMALLDDYDYVVVTVGGLSKAAGRMFAERLNIVSCVPSLFSFSIADKALHELMGLVVENVLVSLPGTNMKADGPLLITHWGMSGPAILKLSSYGARVLAEKDYKSRMSVNWTGMTNVAEVVETLQNIAKDNANRLLSSYRPFGLQQRLWDYLLARLERGGKWGELGQKNINRMAELLCNDGYDIAGRAPFKDEFVTCGGVALDAVDSNTLECKQIPRLFIAGEALDIDGITGGFNFQAAWTTAYVVANGIYKQLGVGANTL